MKPHHARHLAILLCPLLMAACGSSGQQRTARLLDNRLQATLAPNIVAGSASLQQLPDGAVVTLHDASLFPNDAGALADRYPDIRSGVIEGLLDPSLMRIWVADASTLPDDQRAARVQNVNQYFVANGLGSTLQPAAQPPIMPPVLAASTSAGLTITIGVQCPHRHDGTGYGTGQSKPDCY